MSQQLINQYLNDLSDLRRVSGSGRETIVREAFKTLLKGMGKSRDLLFVPEYPFRTERNEHRQVDGALLQDIRVPVGYWEAKDEKDDLEAEIEFKFKRGYPQDNIIFEDSNEAILIQDRKQVGRCDVREPQQLERLLANFFRKESKAVIDFRRAVETFKTDLPYIIKTLKEMLRTAEGNNVKFIQLFDKFVKQAKSSISPGITTDDVREMLMQHILTEEIFAQIFDQSDFHRQNNIAKQLFALESTFFTGQVKQNTLFKLKPYYAAIKSAAALISSHREKQLCLKTVYEGFYREYNPKAADKLGVVYTPNEIVHFMIDGTDAICRNLFDRSLIDKGIEILDPAVGTGTFICELIEYFRGQPKLLSEKYKLELHANEIAILPYYVANLNIESTFAKATGSYEEFENLCFVDTLDNVAGLGKFSGYQESMFGSVSEENQTRIQKQNDAKISVIIGNPPYYANQKSENDNNKNRTYPRVDERISSTYIASSSAQKTKQYDMFVRFVRWSSDRLKSGGIVSFIMNRKFIDGKNFDGFRMRLGSEFDNIWIIDLGGDYKLKNGGGNVFGIGTGVAICFMAKRSNAIKNRAGKIHYVSLGNRSAEEKLIWLEHTKFSDVQFDLIQPDKAHYWIDHPEEDYGTAIPLASKSVKADKVGSRDSAIFKDFCLGSSTNRDAWVYDFSDVSLERKIKYFLSVYMEQDSALPFSGKIKWSRNLKRKFEQGRTENWRSETITQSMYRPFVCKSFYASKLLVDELSDQIDLYAHGPNHAICFTDPAAQKPWMVLAVDRPCDLHLVGSGAGTVCLPRYRISAGSKIDNVPDWALEQFRAHFGSDNSVVTKDSIFDYVYGVLNDPLFQSRFALNLKRGFPEIPLYSDFECWSKWGSELRLAHTGFDKCLPLKFKRTDLSKKAVDSSRSGPILKIDEQLASIYIDARTTLSGLPKNAFRFQLGSRTALEWVLDQYKEKKIDDGTAISRLHDYAFLDYKEELIQLLGRVAAVSITTVDILDAMRSYPLELRLPPDSKTEAVSPNRSRTKLPISH